MIDAHSLVMDNTQKPTDTALQPPQGDQTAQDDSAPGYSRVSPDKASAIVRLKRANPAITGKEIAAAIGVHESTVSRWLQVLDTDTVKESRQLAKSQSLRATIKLADQIEDGDPRVSQGAAKAIVALAGVQEGSAQVQVGVRVIVGSSCQPAGPDPFDNVIDSKPLESES
jgi:hypothetical protein